MTTILLVGAGIAAFAIVYAIWIRPRLKNVEWGRRFLAWIEPVELALYKKSETVLVGRLLWLGSTIVTIHDGFIQYFAVLNWEPFTTRLMDAARIPQDMRTLVMGALLTAVGLIVVKLRKQTTKPLELVSVADANVSPVAALAIDEAEAAKQRAVAVVNATNAH